MNLMFRILSIICLLLLFSCNNSTKNTIEIVDFDGLYSKIDLSVDKTYVINFWATWCAPCVKELPYFEEVNKKYKDKNTEVVLVSLDFPSQIGSKLKPYLKKKGLFFTGIDVIGNYLTEINVTSPTGMQEINRLNSVKLEKIFWNKLEKKINK